MTPRQQFRAAVNAASGGAEVEIVREDDLTRPLTAAEQFGVIACVTAARARATSIQSAPSLLIDYPDAARLLGISVEALQQRVSRGQVPRSAVVRTGRRVQFVRARLPGGER